MEITTPKVLILLASTHSQIQPVGLLLILCIAGFMLMDERILALESNKLPKQQEGGMTVFKPGLK